MKNLKTRLLLLILALFTLQTATAQTAMQNVMARERQSLNGKWYVLTDIMDNGVKNKWGAPKENTDLLKLNELYYEGGMTLNVPGDWNSQNPEFVYYEAPMWYKRNFYYKKEDGKRQFLHFGAVANNAIVFLNGEELGEHRGGFTPFQFEVTGKLNEGQNHVVVRVENIRTTKTVPALNFDWWNYGGITRDVDLVSTPSTFIEDYWVRLAKGSMKTVEVDVKLNGENCANQKVTVSIDGTKYSQKLTTDSSGKATASFNADLELWSPESPRLYGVTVESDADKVHDKIGFRSFEVRGIDIYLNGEPIFLKGINIHEEIAEDRRRSINDEDARYLIDEAAALGCNFIRLSHYPHNEYMVRMCEERGMMMWEEIPVWQNIAFKEKEVCDNITEMMQEMISRDKNRCGIVIWSISNETQFASKERNEFLIGLANKCREWDDTRAISSALDKMKVDPNDNTKLVLNDPLAAHLDIIGLNKYMGWYEKWPVDPSKMSCVVDDTKPIIFSEFGGEAIYANYGDGDNLNSWSEEYMSRVYRENIQLFNNMKNLRGTSPWILFDFRSPRRAHAMYQQGWNRKGLLSPEGNRKRAWYIMKEYYESK
ncbi:MAG: glycoside hydrolase family 2 TIM barrel-domain containing protein [Rikenellaceae bacterium]